MSYLPTIFGNRMSILKPLAAEVSMLDIAAGLSRIPRYLGQYHADHYSVAEHCVLMARKAPPETAIHFLMHDAAEVYMGDIIHPLKVLFPGIKKIEANILAAIYEAFEIEQPSEAVAEHVDGFDMRMRATEKLLLVRDELEWPELDGYEPFDFGFPCWPAAEAEREWINCFESMYSDYLRHRRFLDGEEVTDQPSAWEQHHWVGH